MLFFGFIDTTKGDPFTLTGPFYKTDQYKIENHINDIKETFIQWLSPAYECLLQTLINRGEYTHIYKEENLRISFSYEPNAKQIMFTICRERISQLTVVDDEELCLSHNHPHLLTYIHNQYWRIKNDLKILIIGPGIEIVESNCYMHQLQEIYALCPKAHFTICDPSEAVSGAVDRGLSIDHCSFDKGEFLDFFDLSDDQSLSILKMLYESTPKMSHYGCPIKFLPLRFEDLCDPGDNYFVILATRSLSDSMSNSQSSDYSFFLMVRAIDCLANHGTLYIESSVEDLIETMRSKLTTYYSKKGKQLEFEVIEAHPMNWEKVTSTLKEFEPDTPYVVRPITVQDKLKIYDYNKTESILAITVSKIKTLSSLEELLFSVD